MADSSRLRSLREYGHSNGDHALCSPLRCPVPEQDGIDRYPLSGQSFSIDCGTFRSRMRSVFNECEQGAIAIVRDRNGKIVCFVSRPGLWASSDGSRLEFGKLGVLSCSTYEMYLHLNHIYKEIEHGAAFVITDKRKRAARAILSAMPSPVLSPPPGIHETWQNMYPFAPSLVVFRPVKVPVVDVTAGYGSLDNSDFLARLSASST